MKKRKTVRRFMVPISRGLKETIAAAAADSGASLAQEVESRLSASLYMADSSAAHYVLYAVQKIDAFRDDRALTDWFKGDGELRTICGVTRREFEFVRRRAIYKVAQLRHGARR